MKHTFAAMMVTAGLILAQTSAPGASYNLGVPAVPGTRVPESSPATALPVPQTSPQSGFSAPTMGSSPAAAPGSSAGPAYSFGAAPPPLASPGR